MCYASGLKSCPLGSIGEGICKGLEPGYVAGVFQGYGCGNRAGVVSGLYCGWVFGAGQGLRRGFEEEEESNCGEGRYCGMAYGFIRGSVNGMVRSFDGRWFKRVLTKPIERV